MKLIHAVLVACALCPCLAHAQFTPLARLSSMRGTAFCGKGR